MKTRQGAVKYRGISQFHNRAGDPRLFYAGINAITGYAASARLAKHPIVFDQRVLLLTTKGQNSHEHHHRNTVCTIGHNNRTRSIQADAGKSKKVDWLHP